MQQLGMENRKEAVRNSSALTVIQLLSRVLGDPAHNRPLLALVLGVLSLVVGLECCIGKFLKVDGAYDHSGLETQWHLPRVVELKDNVP